MKPPVFLETNASRLWYGDIALRGRRRGAPAQAAGAPLGVSLAIQSAVLDPLQRLRLISAVFSRNCQRLRLSNRQPKRCNSRLRELPRSKFANYSASLAVSRDLGCSVANGSLRLSAMPFTVSARRGVKSSLCVQRTRVRNPAFAIRAAKAEQIVALKREQTQQTTANSRSRRRTPNFR